MDPGHTPTRLACVRIARRRAKRTVRDIQAFFSSRLSELHNGAAHFRRGFRGGDGPSDVIRLPATAHSGWERAAVVKRVTHAWQSLNGFAATDKVWNPGGKRKHQMHATVANCCAMYWQFARGSLINASVHSQ